MFHNRTQAFPRRGAVIVLTVVMLLVLFGFAGLAIDNGYLFNIHGEVQTAADAGALAGADALFTARDEARQRAEAMAEANYAARQPVTVLPGNVQLGTWNSVERTFTAVADDDSDRVNAVRVVGSRLSVPTFFAGLFGMNQFNVNRQAVAHKIPPCAGIWGTRNVEISGDARTDSYASTDGTYDSSAFRENGDVCSNGPIRVYGNAEVHGDAEAGPHYEIDVIGSAEVTGATSSGATVLAFPPVNFGDVATNNNNAAIDRSLVTWSIARNGAMNITLSGDLVLAPGRYYLNTVELQSQSTISMSGPVTLYITGDVRMNGGSIFNATEDPHNLTIYSTGRTFELYGGSGFYGSLYAPNTDVKLIGHSAYYGQIVGRTVDIGGTADIHVDESLDLWTRPPGPVCLVQ